MIAEILFTISTCAPETERGNLPVAMINGIPLFFVHPDRIGELHRMAFAMTETFGQVRLVQSNQFAVTPNGDLIKIGHMICWN